MNPLKHYRQTGTLAIEAVVLCTALAVSLGLGLRLGLGNPMESDAHYFLQAATSLADGHGYRIRDTFWPDAPAMSRSPGWPFVVSVGLRLFPGVGPDLVMRLVAMACHALAAVLVSILCWRMFEGKGGGDCGRWEVGGGMWGEGGEGDCGRWKVEGGEGEREEDCRLKEEGGEPGTKNKEHLNQEPFPNPATQQLDNRTTSIIRWAALLAGLGYAIHPTALYLAYEGGSEPLFILLVVAGTLMMLRGDRCQAGGRQRDGSRNDIAHSTFCLPLPTFSFSAFLLLGLACLVRPNFLPWVGFYAALVAIGQYRRGKVEGGRSGRESVKYKVESRRCGEGVSRRDAEDAKGEGAGIGCRKEGCRGDVESRKWNVEGRLWTTKNQEPGTRNPEHLNEEPFPNSATQQLSNSTTRQLAPHPHLSVTPLRRRPVTTVVSCIVAVVVFVMPSFLWAVRNYGVSGEFPVLSTLGGQTFYGGNNALTAQTGKWWGYWVFPDAIPGERTMRELAPSMTEREVDAYYWARGKQYLAANPGRIPGLLAGKLVRAYVPVPWAWSWGTAGVSAFRWALYAIGLAGLWKTWRQLSPTVQAALAAMLAANLMTVLVFWGCARFAFPLEVFLLPFAAMVVGKRIED